MRDEAKDHGLATDAITALGYSNGANIAVELLLRHPGLLRAAVLIRPGLAHTPTVLPDLRGTDVMIAAGTADPYTTRTETETLVQLLRRSGAQVEAATQAAGHELTAADLDAVRGWLGARRRRRGAAPMTDYGHELQFRSSAPVAAEAGSVLELAKLAALVGLDLVTLDPRPAGTLQAGHEIERLVSPRQRHSVASLSRSRNWRGVSTGGDGSARPTRCLSPETRYSELPARARVTR